MSIRGSAPLRRALYYPNRALSPGAFHGYGKAGGVTRVIGLTGAIGAGKSEAARILTGLGVAVIDADAEGRRAYVKGTIGWRRLVELFSSRILNEEDEIDRARLGALVFANPQALAWLNAAIHPLIRDRVTQALAERREQGTAVAAIDAALLYQAKWDDLADEVWVVSAPPELALARLTARGMSEEDARKRAAAQGDPEEALRRADLIIENAGSPDDLERSVRQAWEERILSRQTTDIETSARNHRTRNPVR